MNSLTRMKTVLDLKALGMVEIPKPLFIPKGAQAYRFGGTTIIARSYENAEKKARKRGLII